jgi:coenzyme PQQ precursor peptide PqqA
LLIILHDAGASLAPARGAETPLVSTRNDSVNDKPEEAFPTMTWSTPAFEDLRLGFEINLYINNR